MSKRSDDKKSLLSDFRPMTTSYSRAPIVEAMIDIRVAPQPEKTALDLADGFRHLHEDYPHRESLFEGGMFFSEESPPFGWNEGVRYTSKDDQRVFQARTDGFTVSVLPEIYTCWADLRDEARRLWNVYVEVQEPQEITRVALRYVNRFELPDNRPLSEFLTLHPNFSPQLGAKNAFQLRMQFPQPDLEATLLLTQQTIAPDRAGKSRSILLDIDLFRDKIPWKIEHDDAIWEFIEELRNRKNVIFESCITDETRRLIQ